MSPDQTIAVNRQQTKQPCDSSHNITTYNNQTSSTALLSVSHEHLYVVWLVN